MGTKKTPKPHRWANPELAAAMRGLRQSSATQRHTLKSRKGSRAHRSKRAIEDQEPTQAE